MKKVGILGLIFLFVGAVAFAQESGGLSLDAGLGFVMGVNGEKDLPDTTTSPGVDLSIHPYFTDFGGVKLGIALEGSLGFPERMQWKVPGSVELLKKGNSNAFWTVSDQYKGGIEPKQIGSKLVTPGDAMSFNRDDCDTLMNLSFLIGPGVQINFGGAALVFDFGFAGSYDMASFASGVVNNEKQVLDITSFDAGIGANLGLQFRIPMGSMGFFFELGSGFYAYFSRTSTVDWYVETTNAGQTTKNTLWNEKGKAFNPKATRVAPYLLVGVFF